MAEKREILTNRWYIPTVSHWGVRWSSRWVLSIYRNPGDRRERVVYSRGGDDHYTCLRESFSKWVGFTQARVADGTEEHGWEKKEELRPMETQA